MLQTNAARHNFKLHNGKKIWCWSGFATTGCTIVGKVRFIYIHEVVDSEITQSNHFTPL